MSKFKLNIFINILIELFELLKKYAVPNAPDVDYDEYTKHQERYTRPSKEPWRGPHEGKELNLLLSGQKPAGILYKDAFDNFKPYFETKKLKYLILNKDYFIAYLPNEEWRANKIKDIDKKMSLKFNDPFNKPTQKEINIYHIKYGRLLGYTKDEIKKFINRNNK